MTDIADSVELAVYRCFDGALLFVPAVCRPSVEAEAAFGPLTPRGTVAVAPADPAWASLLGQIERHLFVAVPPAQGALLPGLGAHWPPDTALPHT